MPNRAAMHISYPSAAIVRKRGRATVCFITAAFASALSACGGGSSSDRDTGGNDGGTSAGDGTIWVHQGTFLEAFDTATGKSGTSAWIVNAPDRVSCSDIHTMAAADSQIWLGCSDGNALVVDQATGDKSLITIEGADSYGLSHIALGGGYAYAYANTVGADGNDLLRFDLATRALQRAPIEEAFFGMDALLVDAQAVWLLTHNDFQLVKVDPATLTVTAVANLGEDDANPQGPRVDHGGSGAMVQVGNKLWVLNDDSEILSLVSVDKSNLTTTWVDSLADLAALGDGSVGLRTNQANLFAFTCDDSKQGTIIRLDGNTGQRLQTYKIGIGDCNELAFSEHKLYVQSAESVYKLSQMGLGSGAITATFSFGNWVEGVLAE